MKACGEVWVNLVETIHGYMWEVMAYDIAGNEIGERFSNEQAANEFARKLKDY